MSESGYETYLIMESDKRGGGGGGRGIKKKIEKVERKLKYMLSDNKYLTSLSSPSDILNCERGVKELSSLEEEVLREKAEFS